MSTETTKDTLPFTCTPAYDRDACKGCVCSTCYEQEFCDPVQLLCRAGTSEGTMQCLRGSLQLLTKKDLKKAELFVKSAQPLLLDTPESCTLSEHSRPPQRRTAAWPGGEEREKGRRPSQLRVLPLLANYRLPKGRTFIPKIKI